MSRIAVIGTGYVGLVSGTCLSEFGHNVVCVDVDQNKIENLRRGISPIYEPGLELCLRKNQTAGRLHFTTSAQKAVENAEIIFIAVGTPPQEDGSADLHYVLQAAKTIAEYMNGDKIVVDKSTVPVGTGQKVKKVIQEVLTKRDVPFTAEVVSNPEFLREGAALNDFMHPDRIVIGTESKKAEMAMREVYRVLYLNNHPFVFTNIETAELIKYASNAFLATKITFINEMSELCEKVGADIKQVARAMGLDKRIGKYFLHAGPGYGGSCFPKDTRALVKIGAEYGANMSIVKSVITANERQKLRMVDKIVAALGNLEGRTIAVLGLAFKPETDDMRESPAIVIIKELVRRGAKIKAFDPAAMENAKNYAFSDSEITYCENEYQTVEASDAVVLLTEWNQFRSLDLDKVKTSMHGKHFFDMRNIYDEEILTQKGFIYVGVGRA